MGSLTRPGGQQPQAEIIKGKSKVVLCTSTKYVLEMPNCRIEEPRRSSSQQTYGLPTVITGCTRITSSIITFILMRYCYAYAVRVFCVTNATTRVTLDEMYQLHCMWDTLCSRVSISREGTVLGTGALEIGETAEC